MYTYLGHVEIVIFITNVYSDSAMVSEVGDSPSWRLESIAMIAH